MRVTSTNLERLIAYKSSVPVTSARFQGRLARQRTRFKKKRAWQRASVLHDDETEEEGLGKKGKEEFVL